LLTLACNEFGFQYMIFMVCRYIYVVASQTSELISSHRRLVFRTSTAQKTNGEIIVRAFGFRPRASPRLGVFDPEGSHFHATRALFPYIKISKIRLQWTF